MTRLMAPLATYLAGNISIPNTPGLRALQDEAALTDLLDAVIEARREICGEDGPPRSGTAAGSQPAGPPRSDTASGPQPSGPPIFLKVAPDLEPADIDAIARIAIDRKLGALIVSNTTKSEA